MALKTLDYTTFKVVQTTRHQGDVRYGTSKCIYYPFRSFMSVTWMLFPSPGL